MGNNKFVLIPTRSLRSSLMNIFPNLHCEGALPVKYIQGDTNSCVFKSLASAFHCTRIPLLMQAVNILEMRSKQFSGGVTCMCKAQEFVKEQACRVASTKENQKQFQLGARHDEKYVCACCHKRQSRVTATCCHPLLRLDF